MALFPEPPRVPHSLSEGYSGREYRCRKATWSPYRSTKGQWCDECFMLQHEARAVPLLRVRQYATRRRAIKDGPILLLCGPHAQLWHERDKEDR